MMSFFKIKKEVWLFIFPITITIAAIFLTYISYTFSARTVHEQSEIKFNQVVQQIQDSIKTRINSYMTIFSGVEAFYNASDNVSRLDYKKYFKSINLFDNYFGISAVGYLEYVTANQKSSFIKSVQNDKSITTKGYPDFKITPSGDREEYFVMKYIEPFDEQSAIFGLDFGTDPARIKSLLRARDLGMPVVTEKITLLGDKSDIGFVIFVPLYKHNMPLNTVEERRNAFYGAINGAFHANFLFNQILSEQNLSEEVSFKIYDTNTFADQKEIFSYDPLNNFGKDNNDIHQKVIPMDIVDSIWTVSIKADGNVGLSAVEKRSPLIILYLGATLSIALGIIFYFLIFTRYRAEKLISHIRHDLQESEQKIRDIVADAPIIIFSVNTEGILTFAEGKGLIVLGIDGKHVIGKHISDIFSVTPEIITDIEKALAGTELSSTREIGDLIFDIKYTPVSRHSKIFGITIVLVDISEKARMMKNIEFRSNELEKLNNMMIGRELKMIEMKKQILNLQKQNDNKIS